jgi:hypothetical protein
MPKKIGWGLVIFGLLFGTIGSYTGMSASTLERMATAMTVGFAVLATASYYERREPEKRRRRKA